MDRDGVHTTKRTPKRNQKTVYGQKSSPFGFISLKGTLKQNYIAKRTVYWQKSSPLGVHIATLPCISYISTRYTTTSYWATRCTSSQIHSKPGIKPLSKYTTRSRWTMCWTSIKIYTQSSQWATCQTFVQIEHKFAASHLSYRKGRLNGFDG